MTPLVVAAVLVVAVVVVVVVRSRRRRDGVDTFRRQIDALSPEARRPVVDQVQSAAERDADPVDPTGDTPEPDDEHDADRDEEGDGRGT